MNPVISVIVPVYNVASYLPSCIESLLGQSYSALEILLIDDGSTDASGRICDEYTAKDSRIRVIHQKNGGAAAAKNAGLRVASGEYLTFADSDDLVPPDAYEKMISKMKETGAEVVQGSFVNLFTDGQELVPVAPSVDDVERYLVRFTREWTCGLLWNKLYRRELFNGIFFVEGNVIDDEFFTYRGIMNAKRIVWIHDVVYIYRQRKSSVMRTPEKKKQIVLDQLHFLKRRRRDISQRYPNLASAFDEHYLNLLLILSHATAASQESMNEIKAELCCYFRESHVYRPTVMFRLQILRLQLTPIRILLRHTDKPEENNLPDRCFP